MIATLIYLFTAMVLTLLTALTSPAENIDLLRHLIRWILFPLIIPLAIYTAPELGYTRKEMLNELIEEYFKPQH